MSFRIARKKDKFVIQKSCNSDHDLCISSWHTISKDILTYEEAEIELRRFCKLYTVPHVSED